MNKIQEVRQKFLLRNALRILKAVEKIKSTGVPEKILVMAISSRTGMSPDDVRKVLRALKKVKPVVKSKVDKI